MDDNRGYVDGLCTSIVPAFAGVSISRAAWICLFLSAFFLAALRKKPTRRDAIRPASRIPTLSAALVKSLVLVHSVHPFASHFYSPSGSARAFSLRTSRIEWLLLNEFVVRGPFLPLSALRKRLSLPILT